MKIKRIFKESSAFLKGFTLVEMAVVLVIIGLTIGSLTATITAQVEHKAFNETRETLQNVREALLGYAMANGRLPCPAQTPSSGIKGGEYYAASGNSSNGDCGQFYNGFVPAITLGVTPTDINGYVLDSWGNPIRYAVYPLTDGSLVSGIEKKLLTANDGIKNANMSATSSDATCLAKTGMSFVGCMSLLFVCDSSPTATAGASAINCGSSTSLVSNTSSGGGAVFVVYSTGKNGDSGGTGKDEAANPNDSSANDDPVFVSHDPNASGSTNGEFDDLFVWVSANTLFSKLVQANKLP